MSEGEPIPLLPTDPWTEGVLDTYLSAENKAWFVALVYAKNTDISEYISERLIDGMQLEAEIVEADDPSTSPALRAWVRAYRCWFDLTEAIKDMPFLDYTITPRTEWVAERDAADAIGYALRLLWRWVEARNAATAIGAALADAWDASDDTDIVPLTRPDGWIVGESTEADLREGHSLTELVRNEFQVRINARLSEVATAINQDIQSVSGTINRLMNAGELVRVERGRYAWTGKHAS